MEKKKIYYFIWDSKDIDRMVRILNESGMNESIIEELLYLDLKTGTAVVPYPNGYSTYYGIDLSEDKEFDYELIDSEDPEDHSQYDSEVPAGEGPTEETCRNCSAKDCEDRLAAYEPDEVTEVDIDDALDEYVVTEDSDEAFEEYAMVDPEYDDVLETLRVLLHVRDEYRSAEEDAINEAVGGMAEGDYVSLDYSILSTKDGFKVLETEYPSVFSFATEKMAQKFLDNFAEDLEEVSENIGYFM